MLYSFWHYSIQKPFPADNLKKYKTKHNPNGMNLKTQNVSQIHLLFFVILLS